MLKALSITSVVLDDQWYPDNFHNSTVSKINIANNSR